MKKTMKKCLILALVVMTMITVAFCVSAAENDKYCSKCETYVPVTTGEVIVATCESEGYTEVICKPCNDKGIYTRLDKTDKTPARGHQYKDIYELIGTVEEGCYNCVTTCERVISGNRCSYRKTAEYEDHTPIKYYKVTYINPFVASATDSTVKYTQLATAYTEEVIYEEYVKEGTTAAYKATPYRMADKDWGDYLFVGWEFAVQPVPYSAEEPLKYFGGFGVPVEGKTSADYKVYAVFQGLSVAHDVTFYSENGVLLATVPVNHKEFVASGMVPTAPLKADNVEYKFTFDYWTLYDIIGEFDLKKPIYGDVKLKAHYAESLKRYQLKYFDRHGKALAGDIRDFVNIAGFGTIEREKPVNGLNIKKNPAAYGVEKSYFDAAYDYNFTGNWTIPSRENYVIDIEHVTLPSDVLDHSQTNSFIEVAPLYRKVARIYDLNVFVTYDDDLNYHPEEIDIQVTDADGNPIGVSTLTEKDIVKGTENSRTPTYKKVFKVKYSPSYKVVATSKNYKGERTPIFTIDGEDYNDYHPGGCTILMTRIQGDPCGCLCHGIFKPVWVGILNILYNLFKAEFVCCDDMFANIGEDLAYGPSKS